MRIWAIISLLVVTCPFAGCLSDDNGSVWPEPESWDCSIDLSYNLSCSVYLGGLATPIVTLEHPENEELWIVELLSLIHI